MRFRRKPADLSVFSVPRWLGMLFRTSHLFRKGQRDVTKYGGLMERKYLPEGVSGCQGPGVPARVRSPTSR